MDDHHLRSILLNLQYRLSDNDRERLHFYLKNDVPRPVGDDSTLSGTLKLMQSLFDQEKISENDFTLLIVALKQIRCFDAAQLLKEHQRRMLLSGLNQSTQSLASMMPSLIGEYLDDPEDDHHGSTDNLILKQINVSNNNNNIIDSNNITINGNIQTVSSSRKQLFCIPLLINKCFLVPLILFILTLGILIIIFIEGNNRINNLKANQTVQKSNNPGQYDTMEQFNKTLTELNKQNNQTVEQLKNLLSEKNETIEQLKKILKELSNQNNQTVNQWIDVLWEKNVVIEQLNKTLIELKKQNNQTVNQLNNILLEKNVTIAQLSQTLIESEKERKTLLIKAGRQFGGTGGSNFDDSLLRMFTSSHYLSGFLFSDIDSFDSCQFIYKSSRDNQTRIKSNFHGGNGYRINSTYEYYLNADERIEKVQIKSFVTTLMNYYGNTLTTKIIRGLKFVTTKGRIIPPGMQLTGNDVESEQFTGYTLGYVTGKAGTRIDQLQFFWYRTEQ